MLDEILPHLPMQRRSVLRGGLAALFGTPALLACGGGDDDPAPTPVSYGVGFTKIAANTTDTVTVPAGYRVDVLFAAGDAVSGATAFSGTSFLGSADAEKIAGGNHDGMHFYPLPGVDPNRGGLLAINHEFPDFLVLMNGSYDAATATAEQKRLALSAVGVSVIEIERKGNGLWAVKAGSPYNRRYTGNSLYKVSGPAAAAVGSTVVGTLNNCSSGATPWGTYLTCEETTDNYLDPTQPQQGYGWVVEIDPYGELADLPVKRTALGRFDHENAAYLVDGANNVAIYLGDDGTPGCIYKFVPSAPFNPTVRAANANLLDNGTLYAARFNADGSGTWIPLVQGNNGLVAGAVDPGNETQGAAADVTIAFNTQADVLLNTKAAARVAGATLMDRPEWITVGPDKTLYCSLTNNSGRAVTDNRQPAQDQQARPHHPLDRDRQLAAGHELQVGGVPAGRRSGAGRRRRQPHRQHRRRHLLQPGRAARGPARPAVGADRHEPAGQLGRERRQQRGRVRQQRHVQRGPRDPEVVALPGGAHGLRDHRHRLHPGPGDLLHQHPASHRDLAVQRAGQPLAAAVGHHRRAARGWPAGRGLNGGPGLECDRSTRPVHTMDQRDRASRGSSTSRSPSPRRLNPSTDSAMASPGHTASQGAWNIKVWASLSMRPQLGCGGWVPSPR